MSRLITQTACPECTSSDAFSIYHAENGKGKNATCYKCRYWTSDQAIIMAALNGETNRSSSTAAVATSRPPVEASLIRQKVESLDECLTHPIRELSDRGISHATCEKYGVRVGVDTRDGVTPVYHLYPYSDEDGNIIGFKQRFLSDKSFLCIGECSSTTLFGIHTVNPSGKNLFITEGELDALSVYQVLKENSTIDWEPAVVSLPHGARTASKAISANLDLIERYDKVTLVLDNDGPGRAAEKEICKLLAGKVYTVHLSEKDANDMLMKGKGVDLKWACLTGAKKYQPDGILPAKDCWDRYKNASSATCYPYPSSMSGLNEKTYGVRPGSIVTVTAGTGSGKTQFLRELKYHFWQTTDLKMADIALEEDVGDTLGGLISLHLNKRVNLPDVEVSEEEERRAFEELFGSDRFTLYDFFGGMDDDNLFSRLNYFAATGHELIFLDHLSIIISEYAAEGGERERIDQIMTKLVRFVKETGTIVFLVVHLRKNDISKKSFEQGAVPSSDDLRGSGGIKQCSWDIISLSRNQQHPILRVANTTELTVLKCRFTGRTGHAGYLYFDDTTGRMVNSTPPVIEQEEK